MKSLYTKEDCIKIIENYENLIDLKRENKIIYNLIYRKGWNKELLKNLNRKHKPNGFWNKTKCLEIARTYSSILELAHSELSLCAVARQNGWLTEIYECIKLDKWSKLECLEFSKKWKTKSEFHKNNREIYNFSKESGFLNEICDHMNKKSVVLETERMIYSYTFFDKYVYVGVTNNIKRRHGDHMREGSIFEFIKKNNIIKNSVKPVIEISGIINAHLASEMEGVVLEEKEKQGLIKINKAKTGSLGGNQRKWTKELIFEEAKKFETRTAFAKNSSAYSTAQQMGILDEVCVNMNTKKSKGKNYWTKSRCKLVASKFTNKRAFFDYEGTAYSKSLKSKWLDEFFPIIENKINKEEIKNIVIKFENRTQLYKSNPKIYRICLENNWLNEFFPILNKDEIYCRNKVVGFKNRSELYSKNHTLYRLCTKFNLLDELFPIKKRDLTTREFYLNKENARKETLKYSNRCILSKENQTLYRVCVKFNWLDEFLPKKPKIEYNYVICKNHATEYSCRKDYAAKKRSFYDFASKNGWLDDFFPKTK